MKKNRIKIIGKKAISISDLNVRIIIIILIILLGLLFFMEKVNMFKELVLG